MASKLVETLAKENKVLIPFINWYKVKYATKLAPNTFFSLPFEFQLGVFIEFFEEEYNYGIHADRESFVILYPNINKAKDIINARPGKLLDKDNIEYTDFNSIMIKSIFNYERAMLKIIDLIINPF
jgi:hypothetical protein